MLGWRRSRGREGDAPAAPLSLASADNHARLGKCLLLARPDKCHPGSPFPGVTDMQKPWSEFRHEKSQRG